MSPEKLRLSKETGEFNPRTRKSTRQGVLFLRETLLHLNGDAFSFLVRFLPLYAEKEREHPSQPVFAIRRDFARLGEIVLREAVGGKSFREIAGESQNGRSAQQVGASFHFWLGVASLLFPENEPSLPEKLKAGPRFRNAEEQAKLALARADIALRMAKVVEEEQETLQALGVSYFTRELWVMALLGYEDRLLSWQEQDGQESDRFRRNVINGPAVATLLNLRERVLANLLLERRQPALSFLEGLPEASSSVPGLRWWGKKSPKERERIITALLKVAGRTPFKKIDWSNDPLSPKTKAAYLQAILKSLAHFYDKKDESAGGLNSLRPGPGEARALVALAKLNFERERGLLSERVKRRFEKIVQTSGHLNFSLSEGDILTVILVMSRKPFDPYEFRKNLKEAKGLADFSFMLESKE